MTASNCYGAFLFIKLDACWGKIMPLLAPTESAENFSLRFSFCLFLSVHGVSHYCVDRHYFIATNQVPPKKNEGYFATIRNTPHSLRRFYGVD
jgi:hypothetical protein